MDWLIRRLPDGLLGRLTLCRVPESGWRSDVVWLARAEWMHRQFR